LIPGAPVVTYADAQLLDIVRNLAKRVEYLEKRLSAHDAKI